MQENPAQDISGKTSKTGANDNNVGILVSGREDRRKGGFWEGNDSVDLENP